MKIQLPPNKNFGLFFSLVFFLIAVFLFFKYSLNISLWMLGLALIFLLVSYLKPNILYPLNKLWMYFGYYLGKIISPIVLGVIFFGIFTPIAVFFKLIGRDELYLKDQNRDSHWKNRTTDFMKRSGFEEQF